MFKKGVTLLPKTLPLSCVGEGDKGGEVEKMTDNITAGDVILEYIIPVVGILIAAITAFGVFYGPRLVAKRQEKKDKLRKHFDELKPIIIMPLLMIIGGIKDIDGYLEATTTSRFRTMEDVTNQPVPMLFGFEDRDEYQAFQTHYPKIEESLRKLMGKIWKHNEVAKELKRKITEHLESDPNLPPIKKEAHGSEQIIYPDAPNRVFQTIYSLSHAENPQYDFTKAVDEESGASYIIRVGDTAFIRTTKDKAQYCKSALIKLQELGSLRSEATDVWGSANQILFELRDLAETLNHVLSRGLISKHPGYKFEPLKRCSICRELFY